MAILNISVIALVGALVLGIYHYIIYPAFISPLARIPNAHWSAPFSSFWILWTRYKCRENRMVNAAHRKLGPVVRLGPEEISVNQIDGGVRTVYGGGFEKGQWYSIFDNYGVPCMFSSLGSREHSVRKRFISHIYSKSVVQNSESHHEQAKVILYDRLLPLISGSTIKAGPYGLDVLETWNALTMDFITAYLFGMGIASNFLQNKIERRHWLKLYHSRKTYTFFSQELPRLTKFCHAIGIRLVPTWVDDANRELEDWTREKCKLGIQFLASETAKKTTVDPVNDPVVLRALLAGIDKEEREKGPVSVLSTTTLDYPELSVASEMLDHLAAGQETSGITLTYLSWHLSQDLKLQKALRDELLTLDKPIIWKTGAFPASETDRDLPDSKQLDALPLLHAIVMETLRLDTAIPGGQPRMTPYPSCVIGDYQVPGGVRVDAAAYHLHRNESVYPDPLEWNPSRWLENPGKQERDRWFWAFSSGGRMCIGSNFAMHEIKLIVAAVYSNFTSHIVDDDGIEQADGYTCGPVRNKLFLRFEKVEQ